MPKLEIVVSGCFNRPGLNFSKKCLLNMTSIYLVKVNYNVLFTYLLTISIKRPGLDFWKKSLLNDQ